MKLQHTLTALAGALGLLAAANAATVNTVEFSEIGIPYGLAVTLNANDSAVAPPDHVGAWSWDEDSFPATAKGWTHTSKFVQLELTENAVFTLTLASAEGVPWPATDNAARLAGTNLFPSFTLYRGWDTDVGVTTNADGTTLDQDHTFNNRGNIAWAEDVTYLDHLDNSTAHTATRTWILPAGKYTVNLGGNSPVTLAEGRQGYAATFSTTPAPGAIAGGFVSPVAFSEIGIPYGLKVQLGATGSAVAPPDHVGAWSWDEDSFPATAKGWTHTSKFVQLDLTEAATFTLTLSSATGVPWPATDDAARLAGTNLFPSFTLYRGWDTDAGVTTNADGTTLDQDHTFNNRGNIAWAEDVAYLDHLDNAAFHRVTRTWDLPAGRYTINLGGNSPVTLAEGRQGYRATLTTSPAAGIALETHSALEAVDAKGLSTWAGTLPFELIGVLLNNPEEFLDATPGFLPFTVENTFRLGGQWQIFFQSADPADRGGAAAWMGQNYGNLPFIRDTMFNYTDAQWMAEIARLEHDPATGHRFRKGDLIRVVANRTLDFAGKRNVNEAHDTDPAANWEIHLVQAGFGLPEPAVVTLAQLVRPDDGNPATSEEIFDATRTTGGEHWQASRVRINGLTLTDASGWGKAAYNERVCQATDGTGRIFRLRVPRLDLGAAPTGAFDAIGILDQDSGSGSDGTTGYELFVQQVVRPVPVLAVTRNGDNLVLSWPVEAGDPQLFQATAVNAAFTPVTATPVAASGRWNVTVPVAGAAGFFRLQQPAAGN